MAPGRWLGSVCDARWKDLRMKLKNQQHRRCEVLMDMS